MNVRYAVSSESGGTWIARDGRPGVAAAHPDLGPNHGFIVATYAAAGPHHVCVAILDPKGGPDRPLGCLNTTVPADQLASGHLDAVTSAPATHIHVAGWAFDPDVATQPWRVSIYLGGTYGHAFKSVSVAADHSRPDAAAVYPGAGAAHGFDLSIAARPGTYPVCAYAPDDYPYGASRLIGCITVTVSAVPTRRAPLSDHGQRGTALERSVSNPSGSWR